MGWQKRADRERGASAVEFALVLPLLMLFLFGIIQYGYGLFQLQSFNAALGDASRLASTGILNCGTFNTTWRQLAGDNGLPTANLGDIDVEWLTAAGGASSVADRAGLARVTASYEPFRIGLPGVPFPERVTRTRTVVVQDIGDTGLSGC